MVNVDKDVPPWPSAIVYVMLVVAVVPGSKVSKSLPVLKLYDPSGWTVNVPPFVPAIAVPGATDTVPFVMLVTESGSRSGSVSFRSRPSGATTEIEVCGNAELTSTLAVGASFSPLTMIVTVAVLVPPWPSLT